MSQFGSMDEETVKKPLLLPLSAKTTTTKKKPTPPSFLSEVQWFSLLVALFTACFYAGLAAYNLRDRQHCPPPRQEPENASAWFIRSYVVTGAGVVDASRALWRGLMWCSAPQAAAAALALALLEAGRGPGTRRAAALVALAATAASHWMYASVLGMIRINNPGDIFLTLETASLAAAAALDLLGFMAFLLGGGGGDE